VTSGAQQQREVYEPPEPLEHRFATLPVEHHVGFTAEKAGVGVRSQEIGKYVGAATLEADHEDRRRIQHQTARGAA
jgi:hypothetical protein